MGSSWNLYDAATLLAFPGDATAIFAAAYSEESSTMAVAMGARRRNLIREIGMYLTVPQVGSHGISELAYWMFPRTAGDQRACLYRWRFRASAYGAESLDAVTANALA